MATFAVVNKKSKVVENVIVWDGETPVVFPNTFTLVESDTAAIGDSYISGEFVKPIIEEK